MTIYRTKNITISKRLSQEATLLHVRLPNKQYHGKQIMPRNK